MQVTGGATDVTRYFALRKTSDGTAATGLTITGFDLQYVRSGAAPSAKVDATALAATDSAHADNKAIEIDGTDQPGLYRVDWPDAAFAAGVPEVVLTVKVATAFTEHLAVQIDAPVNMTKWAGTAVVAGAIPAVPADAAGGLPVSDAGGLDLDNRTPASGTVTNLNTLYDGVEGFAPAYMGPRGPGVYLNDAAANTSTVNGVDGTWNNPVSTIAAAKTIADSLSVDRIYLVNDTAITLAAAMEDYEFVGIGEMMANTINLGSQDVDNSHFENVLISGAQGGTGRLQAKGCVLSVITAMEITALECLLAGGTLTLRNDCAFHRCCSTVAGGGTPILDINSVADVNVYFRDYSGGLQVNNAVATTVMSYDCPTGQIVIDGTCTSLTIHVRGNCTITDNGTTTSLTQDAAVNRTNINAEVDAAISDAALATAANLVTVDTVVDAIKTITDNLPNSGALTTIGTDTARLTAVRAAVLTDWINGGRLDVIMDAILADTGTDGVALSTAVKESIADIYLTRQMTESYNADGAAPTPAQAFCLLIAALTEFSISGTTITVKKLDGSTTAATFTLDDATNPTSRTRAT
jgi:hypothetical protein